MRTNLRILKANTKQGGGGKTHTTFLFHFEHRKEEAALGALKAFGFDYCSVKTGEP